MGDVFLRSVVVLITIFWSKAETATGTQTRTVFQNIHQQVELYTQAYL